MAVNEGQWLEHIFNISMTPVDTFNLGDGSCYLLVQADRGWSADQYLCSQHRMLPQEQLGKGEVDTEWITQY